MKDDFLTQLDYEKSRMSSANKFYSEHLGAVDINRWKWSDRVGRVMQRNDIDCSITIERGDRFSGINISEKFRRVDWGDMLIELYSEYPAKKGWGLTHQEVDEYAYFAGEHTVYMVEAENLKEISQRMLDMFNTLSNYDYSFLENLKKYGCSNIIFTYYDKPYDVSYRYISTTRENIKWYGVTVSIPWELLEEMGVKIKKYNI